ncbi:MAG: SlyX family protein [Thiotrichaceae bacterium]|nr:SlyX family protein [Thiotrichaceae bacterium]PCI13001.1 MAG: hypothetical protein COB71_07200 [Thiotrichales bacterium]
MENEITDLQIRLTHQEATLEELNQVIIQQQKSIDQLTHAVSQVNERMRSMADSNIADPSQETPPPHY